MQDAADNISRDTGDVMLHNGSMKNIITDSEKDDTDSRNFSSSGISKIDSMKDVTPFETTEMSDIGSLKEISRSETAESSSPSVITSSTRQDSGSGIENAGSDGCLHEGKVIKPGEILYSEDCSSTCVCELSTSLEIPSQSGNLERKSRSTGDYFPFSDRSSVKFIGDDDHQKLRSGDYLNLRWRSYRTSRSARSTDTSAEYRLRCHSTQCPVGMFVKGQYKPSPFCIELHLQPGENKLHNSQRGINNYELHNPSGVGGFELPNQPVSAGSKLHSRHNIEKRELRAEAFKFDNINRNQSGIETCCVLVACHRAVIPASIDDTTISKSEGKSVADMPSNTGDNLRVENSVIDSKKGENIEDNGKLSENIDGLEENGSGQEISIGAISRDSETRNGKTEDNETRDKSVPDRMAPGPHSRDTVVHGRKSGDGRAIYAEDYIQTLKDLENVLKFSRTSDAERQSSSNPDGSNITKNTSMSSKPEEVTKETKEESLSEVNDNFTTDSSIGSDRYLFETLELMPESLRDPKMPFEYEDSIGNDSNPFKNLGMSGNETTNDSFSGPGKTKVDTTMFDSENASNSSENSTTNISNSNADNNDIIEDTTERLEFITRVSVSMSKSTENNKPNRSDENLVRNSSDFMVSDIKTETPQTGLPDNATMTDERRLSAMENVSISMSQVGVHIDDEQAIEPITVMMEEVLETQTEGTIESGLESSGLMQGSGLGNEEKPENHATNMTIQDKVMDDDGDQKEPVRSDIQTRENLEGVGEKQGENVTVGNLEGERNGVQELEEEGDGGSNVTLTESMREGRAGKE